MNTHIETERLIMRPLDERDFHFIYELLNTEGWIKNIGNRNINSLDDASAYIDRINSNQNYNCWVVLSKENNETLGMITDIKRDYLEHRDIGFAFLPRFHKNNFAYEAAKTMLTTMFESKQKAVLAICIPSNLPSINLLKKLGLTFKQEIMQEDLLHMYEIKNGQQN